MDAAGNQYYWATSHDASVNDGGTAQGTDACIAATDLTGGTLDMKAAFTSMDSNGFTVTVSEGGVGSPYYEAYG